MHLPIRRLSWQPVVRPDFQHDSEPIDSIRSRSQSQSLFQTPLHLNPTTMKQWSLRGSLEASEPLTFSGFGSAYFYVQVSQPIS